MNSPLLIREIMRARMPVPDPAGRAGLLYWEVPGSLRMGLNTEETAFGIWELLVNPATKEIFHFVFKSRTS